MKYFLLVIFYLLCFMHPYMCFKFEWINRSIILWFVKITLCLLFTISMFSVDFHSREPLIYPSFVWTLSTASFFPDQRTLHCSLSRSNHFTKTTFQVLQRHLSFPENIWIFDLDPSFVCLTFESLAQWTNKFPTIHLIKWFFQTKPNQNQISQS